MMNKETNRRVPDALALAALAWTLADQQRAERLLDTTGLSPEELRGGLGDPAMLAAAVRFLEAHEPDLIACAEELNVSPTELVEARRSLER